MGVILVVDDEPAIRHAFARAFRDSGLTLHLVSTACEALTYVTRTRPDVIVLDVHLPDATGMETFRRLRALDARIPIILITGHGTAELAIEAMKEGAFEYLLKPLELKELRAVIDRAAQSSRLMNVPAAIPDLEVPPPGGDVLLGRCAAMQEVYKAIGRVAPQDVTVLLTGESGTGKELVARAIYQHSRRAHKTFLAINCAAIPETLLESELFGHEKGAFTGAQRRRIGKFEQASGGTIFLDEVGEMPSLTQAKILRLIQEQTFERVGGSETIHTDVRLIAATNADLDRLVQEGRFRKDLYFRLNVFSIHLPPLREREGDLELLVEHFVQRFGQELGKPVREVEAAAWNALRAYSWPGNVRELQSVLKQAILRMSGSVLLVDYLPEAVRRGSSSPARTWDEVEGYWEKFIHHRLAAGSENLYAECLEQMERELLTRVLQHTHGNQLQAARILGITRGSLRRKIRSLGITISRSVTSEDEASEMGR
jgi:two-component system nitrogen regulation response regulator GlnG